MFFSLNSCQFFYFNYISIAYILIMSGEEITSSINSINFWHNVQLKIIQIID